MEAESSFDRETSAAVTDSAGGDLRIKSVTLSSRTFIGLLLAQFTATFNDQATHIVAVFFAVDMLIHYVGSTLLDEKAIPALVALCFMLPFFIFSPLSGRVADKYSKRSIIVLWKVIEVLVMLLALGALSIPALVGPPGPSEALARTAAFLMIASVFFMGLHSTFFVPAKYGIMPEILHPTVLSRGNGYIEGTSFMAQIFGTSAGGILYALMKSGIDTESGRRVLVPGQEWGVGLMLLGLASLGTITAFLMQPVPAADPHHEVGWTWWGPLKENLGILFGAKPLTLALIGVTFVAFMTVFLRQTLLYEAELRDKPNVVERLLLQEESAELPRPTGEMTTWERLEVAVKQPELKVSLLIALVGFGVGLGSVCAGLASGSRVELGLVPVGAVLMVVLSATMTMLLDWPWVLVVVLFLLGLSAGFVVVPLYTQMQHRAPKESKGNIIAAANWIYVCAGIGAVALFYILAWLFERSVGLSLTLKDVEKIKDAALQKVLGLEFLQQLKAQMLVPRMLMGMTCLCTVAMSAILWSRQRDFPLRTALWLRRMRGWNCHVVGIDHLPLNQPLVLQAESGSLLEALGVMTSIDRFARMIVVQPDESGMSPGLRLLARWAGVIVLRRSASPAQWQRAVRKGRRALASGHAAGITCLAGSLDDATRAQVESLLGEWSSIPGTQIQMVAVS